MWGWLVQSVFIYGLERSECQGQSAEEQSPPVEVKGEETEMTLRWGHSSKESLGGRVSHRPCVHSLPVQGTWHPQTHPQEAQPPLPLSGLIMGTPRA